MQVSNGTRLLSLDILRGFDMFFIMGSPILFKALAKITDCEPFIWISSQMKHCVWDGFAWMDLVFPLFLFISGITFPISYNKNICKPDYSKKKFCKYILRRVAVLVVLGMLYNGLLSTLSFSENRYCSVLGRIGIAWGIAAFIYMGITSRIKRVLVIFAILMGYWLIFLLFKAPDAIPEAHYLSPEGNIAGYIDRLLIPGQLYMKDLYEAEGILSTIPSVATAMLGMFLGDYMFFSKDLPLKKIRMILLVGGLLVLLGWCWGMILPINKTLWSSSFVLFVGGLSALLFALFYWIFDVKAYCSRVGLFFKVIGMNSIFIYLLQKIINFNDVSQFFIKGVCSYLPDNYDLLLLGMTRVALCWLILYFMYKRSIFFKV